MCNVHLEEFFELNDQMPENVYELDFEEKQEYLINATYPNQQGCAECWAKVTSQ